MASPIKGQSPIFTPSNPAICRWDALQQFHNVRHQRRYYTHWLKFFLKSAFFHSHSMLLTFNTQVCIIRFLFFNNFLHKLRQVQQPHCSLLESTFEYQSSVQYNDHQVYDLAIEKQNTSSCEQTFFV
jgi:hypothetical protein